MTSGVGIHPECVKVYNDLQLGHMYRYIVFSLSDDLREVRVLTTGEPSCSYDDFVYCLKQSEPLKQCRYGVFDADFGLSDGQKRTKLVFFLWSPECATVKQKMVYSSSKGALKKCLNGLGKEVQACDYAELAWTNVLEHLLRTEKKTEQPKKFRSEMQLMVGFT